MKQARPVVDGTAIKTAKEGGQSCLLIGVHITSNSAEAIKISPRRGAAAVDAVGWAEGVVPRARRTVKKIDPTPSGSKAVLF